MVPVPVFLPIGSEHKFNGVVDIVQGKAFIDGKVADIPADMADLVEESRMALMESVAESDDDLLEKYFEAGELTDEELSKGIKSAIIAGKVIPAFACSATQNIAVDEVINAIVEYLPSPADTNELAIVEGDEEKTIVVSEDGNLVAFIFRFNLSSISNLKA